MPHVKLNQRFVDSICLNVEQKKQEWFDIEIKGFYLEVRRTGGKTYRMRLKDKFGKLAVLNLGDAACVPFLRAREEARNLRARAQLGEWQVEASKVNFSSELTLSEFVEEHYLPFIRQRKRSVHTDVSILNNHILPAFGARRLSEISKAELVVFHTSKREQGYAPGTVDRMLVLIRYMFNLACKWGLLISEQHPVKNFDFFNVPNGRERYLSAEEVERLVHVLELSENKDLSGIVHGLLLTGCRRGELLNARWEDVDLEKGIWKIPLTKQGKPHYIPLTNDLKDYFIGLASRGQSEFLFPSPLTGRPYKSIYYSWDRARRLAGMPELRIHDLRHSFASFLVNSGRSLYEVQRLLGHTSPRTTQRYAHLSINSLLEAIGSAKTAISVAEDSTVQV
jgi:integrase